RPEYARAEVWRHAARALARGAAARRHCTRHRPHRDADLRRGEPARGRAVSDEPARRGPDDGCALGGVTEAAARAAYPARPAGQELGRMASNRWVSSFVPAQAGIGWAKVRTSMHCFSSRKKAAPCPPLDCANLEAVGTVLHCACDKG